MRVELLDKSWESAKTATIGRENWREEKFGNERKWKGRRRDKNGKWETG